MNSKYSLIHGWRRNDKSVSFISVFIGLLPITGITAQKTTGITKYDHIQFLGMKTITETTASSTLRDTVTSQ